MALAVGDQFGDGAGRRGQRRSHQHRQRRHQRDRREVTAGVVGQGRIQAGVDGMRGQHHQQGVAVRLGARQLRGRDGAARARAVQHHEAGVVTQATIRLMGRAG
ncbi:hypothetical protein G6F54_014066 [Rhizopus delemar]|nr:hypothetical protein G6F54_014066 [Rhizopus delemar]